MSDLRDHRICNAHYGQVTCFCSALEWMTLDEYGVHIEHVAAIDSREAADAREVEVRARIARCLSSEAHGRNDAVFNRALRFAAGCALARYDQHDAHSFCLDPKTCPRCAILAPTGNDGGAL